MSRSAFACNVRLQRHFFYSPFFLPERLGLRPFVQPAGADSSHLLFILRRISLLSTWWLGTGTTRRTSTTWPTSWSSTVWPLITRWVLTLKCSKFQNMPLNSLFFHLWPSCRIHQSLRCWRPNLHDLGWPLPTLSSSRLDGVWPTALFVHRTITVRPTRNTRAVCNEGKTRIN